MIQTFTLNKDRRRSDVLNSLIYRIPTKLLSNPVQPTAFSDDPALSTHRPLVIVTPSQSGESTASIIL